MDGKGRAIDKILQKDYGVQSNTRMYIYKNMLTESVFIKDLKGILNFIIHGNFISHQTMERLMTIITKKKKWHKIGDNFFWLFKIAKSYLRF